MNFLQRSIRPVTRNVSKQFHASCRFAHAAVAQVSEEIESSNFESATASTFEGKLNKPMIIPQFASEVPALDFEEYSIDCSSFDMSLSPEEAPELSARMQETFDRTGLCLLTNTNLTNVGIMSNWAKNLVSVGDYQGGANSRGELYKNVYDTGAPREAHLHYHTEMAYMAKSVRSLAFCADKATPDKGFMYVSDKLATTDSILRTQMGQKLKDKGICYIRCLTDREAYADKDDSGTYNHWQTSFNTDSREEVERLAAQRGLEIEWSADGFLKTKCYISGFEYFPLLDRNVIYSSVADDAIWFDTWPGVMELPTMPSYEAVSAEHRPLLLTFGDDTPFTYEELKLFVDVHDLSTIPIKWQVGDVLAVCNYRWAHGRPAYTLDHAEERNLGVVLGSMYEREGQRDDKWRSHEL